MDNVMIKRCAPGDDEHRENLVNYLSDERKLAMGGNGVDYHDPDAVIMQMQTVTDYFDKSHRCPAVQLIVAFDEKVKDADTAVGYIKEIAERLPDEYQSLYCVHEKDAEYNSYHGHILINPVSTKDGRQFDTSCKNVNHFCDEITEVTGNENQLIFKRNR